MTSDGSSQDKCVDVVSAFIRIDGLQICCVSNNVILIYNSIATQHITSFSCNIQRFATVVSLNDADHFRCQHVRILQLRNLVYSVQTQSYFSHHICHFQLWNLHCCERLSKLVPVEHVVPRLMETKLSSSHSAPSDTEPCLVKAAERTFESFDI